MMERKQTNQILSKAFFGMRCSASCLKKAEVQDLIWRLQPIDEIFFRLNKKPKFRI
jgi:hypothetical protein